MLTVYYEVHSCKREILITQLLVIQFAWLLISTHSSLLPKFQFSPWIFTVLLDSSLCFLSWFESGRYDSDMVIANLCMLATICQKTNVLTCIVCQHFTDGEFDLMKKVREFIIVHLPLLADFTSKLKEQEVQQNLMLTNFGGWRDWQQKFYK